MSLFSGVLECLVLLAGEGAKGPVKLALMTGAVAVIALVINFFVGETSWHSVSIILLVAALFWVLLAVTEFAAKALKRSGNS